MPRNPPFSLTKARNRELPIVLAVPHAGRDYSGEVLANMRSPDIAMMRLEDRYVDLIAEEAIRQAGVSLLVAHVPRAVLDLNRSKEDVDWSMISGVKKRPIQHSLANRRARSGLGIVPRRLPGFGEIWRKPLPHSELQARIEKVHRPYHQSLGQELARLRDVWGAALLVDLHSMPPLRARAGEPRGTEFVIGDRFGASCDTHLVSKTLNYLESYGRLTTHNRPYSGGYVLDAHGLPRHGIHAIQLEVCRSIYLDDNLDQPATEVAKVGELVGNLLRMLGEEVAMMGKGGCTALAAE